MDRKRNTVTNLIALAKSNLLSVISQVANKEVFKVRLYDESKYQERLLNITNKLDNLTTTINLLAHITSKLDNLAKRQIDVQSVSENSIDTLLGELRDAVYALQDKNIIFPEVQKIQGKVEVENQKYPKIQQIEGKIEGKVKVLNPPDMKRLIQAMDSVKEAVLSINISIPPQKEIKMPEFPEFPKTIGMADSKAIIKALGELKQELKTLPREFPEVEFPKTVTVDNFPNQKVPNPVTNISINSLGGYVKSRTTTVSSSLTPLPGEVLSNRRAVVIFNNSSSTTIYVGGANVTSSDGIPVPAQTYAPPVDAGSKMVVYAVTASGTADTRTLEVSDISIGR